MPFVAEGIFEDLASAHTELAAPEVDVKGGDAFLTTVGLAAAGAIGATSLSVAGDSNVKVCLPVSYSALPDVVVFFLRDVIVALHGDENRSAAYLTALAVDSGRSTTFKSLRNVPRVSAKFRFLRTIFVFIVSMRANLSWWKLSSFRPHLNLASLLRALLTYW